MPPRILLAEDEHQLRTTVSEYLRGEGFDVLEAAHGAQALHLAREAQLDALVLDVHMPVMGAPAVLSTWTADPKLNEIPVVLVSAAPGLSDLATMFGVRATLTKPFDLHILLTVLQRLLAGQGPGPLRDNPRTS